MASIRAYYLPANSASAIDTSHQASVEQLNTLGWRISSVGGGPDEIEESGRKLAQELRFPVTQEGCVVPFNCDLEKNAATMTPEVIIVDLPQKQTSVCSLPILDVCLSEESSRSTE